MTLFTSLGLEERLLKALAHQGYETPTPIQEQAIPHVLAGKDLLGIAQTGTGKTASFALPILQRLMGSARAPAPKSPRALILSPTRELAAQIADSFRDYGRFLNVSITTIFGGVAEGPQRQNMLRGVDVLVATPGRLLDLVSQRAVDLTKTEILVLDEADRMLDMGFINDIRKLVRYLPSERQNLFFSATMPQEIGKLAGEMLRNPVQVSVTPQATTVERINQRVIHVPNGDKRALLVHLLRSDTSMSRVLVFTRTKHGADKIVRALDAAGIYSSALHGNKSQSQRVNTLNAFRAGRAPVLIATDIAARGIDVDGITHVVNFDLPHVPESYVHRIGRTARAGADGIAIAFCDREERPLLRDIEKVTRQQIPASEWHATDRTPGEAASPVLTHEQKQDFRKQRETERYKESPARSSQGRPPRKGAHPRRELLDHMQSEGARPSVVVEPREPHSDSRGGKDPQHPGKPRTGKAPGGKPRLGNYRPEYRGNRDAEQRTDQRPDQRAEPRGDRPFQGKPRGDRPFAGKPSGDRPFQPRGDRPYQDKPRGDRPSQGKPAGDRPFQARGDRPYQDKPRGDRPFQGKPSGDRPFKPRGDRPQQPRGDRPFQARTGDRPQGGKPRSEGRGPNRGAPSQGRRSS